MTVCIAALAERSRAIVLVADKALTYGDNIYTPAMQGDTGIKKILPIAKSGWMVMTAGSAGTCDRIVRQMSAMVAETPAIARSATEMSSCVESVYRTIYEELAVERVLKPRLLTKTLWASRPSSLLPLHESIVNAVSEELSRFHIGSDLLLCGFDDNDKANIITLGHPGVAHNETNSGFAAIGSGALTAIGRLLWQKVTRSEHLEEVLYEAYDAKAHAEEIQGVGYSCDIRIIVGSRIVAPKRGLYRLIDNVFEVSTMTPFGKKEKLPLHWQRKLRTFRKAVMRKKGKRRITKKRHS